MPLKEASCDVVLMLTSTWLYCATKAARVACEFGSATGAPGVRLLKAAPLAVAVPVMTGAGELLPMVADAALLVLEMAIGPDVSTLPCKLFATNVALSWLS